MGKSKPPKDTQLPEVILGDLAPVCVDVSRYTRYSQSSDEMLARLLSGHDLLDLKWMAAWYMLKVHERFASDPIIIKRKEIPKISSAELHEAGVVMERMAKVLGQLEKERVERDGRKDDIIAQLLEHIDAIKTQK